MNIKREPECAVRVYILFNSTCSGAKKQKTLNVSYRFLVSAAEKMSIGKEEELYWKRVEEEQRQRATRRAQLLAAEDKLIALMKARPPFTDAESRFYTALLEWRNEDAATKDQAARRMGVLEADIFDDREKKRMKEVEHRLADELERQRSGGITSLKLFPQEAAKKMQPLAFGPPTAALFPAAQSPAGAIPQALKPDWARPPPAALFPAARSPAVHFPPPAAMLFPAGLSPAAPSLTHQTVPRSSVLAAPSAPLLPSMPARYFSHTKVKARHQAVYRLTELFDPGDYLGGGAFGFVFTARPTRKAISDGILAPELADREFALKVELEKHGDTTTAEATMYVLLLQSQCPKLNVARAYFWTRVWSANMIEELGKAAATSALAVRAGQVLSSPNVFSVILQDKLTGPTLNGLYMSRPFDRLTVPYPPQEQRSSWNERAAVVLACVAAQMYTQLNMIRKCISADFMHNDLHASNVMCDAAGFSFDHWIIYELEQPNSSVLVVPLFLTLGAVLRIMDFGLATGTYAAVRDDGRTVYETINPRGLRASGIDATHVLADYVPRLRAMIPPTGSLLDSATKAIDDIPGYASLSDYNAVVLKKDFYTELLAGPIVAALRTKNNPDAIKQRQLEIVRMFEGVAPPYSGKFVNIFVSLPPTEPERLVPVEARVK
jgi:hypothetical protein